MQGYACLNPLNRDQIEAAAAASSIQANNPLLRDRIVRRLSRRAGVSRTSNEGYHTTWCTMVYMIYQLAIPALSELMDAYRSSGDVNSWNGKRLLAANETMRTVPPLPLMWKCEETGNDEFFYTIAPQQFEDAARSVFGSLSPCKVYGDEWLVPGIFDTPEAWSDAVDKAIAEAEDQYEYEEDEIMHEEFVVVSEFGPADAEMQLSDDDSSDYLVEDDSIKWERKRLDP